MPEDLRQFNFVISIRYEEGENLLGKNIHDGIIKVEEFACSLCDQ